MRKKVAVLEARDRSGLTQAEIARRMGMKTPCVSRFEWFGATTIQSLMGYAKACGYSLRIIAESPVLHCFSKPVIIDYSEQLYDTRLST